jgi:class 3 adenylate cyclase
VQVGRQWGAANDLGSIQTDLIQTEGELVRLFPELRGRPGIVEPREVVDPQGAQFRLFDAYATFLRALCSTKEKEPRPSGSGQGGPVVLVLDDLHWSDKPTLQLLQHVARDLAHLRILVVCTYRDTDLSRTHPLSEALAGLNRDPGFQRVVLRGLTKEEVGAYINATAPEPVRPDVVERIYDETEGNPFFLSEVVNLLTQEGTLGKESVSDIRIPDGVKEALGRRLDRLSAEANELLQVAAIVGREFTYDTLSLLQVVAASPGRVASDAGPAQEETLLRILEEGIEARVIEESGQAGRYRFTHALMQETLLSELSTTRRVRLHGQVGEALERRWGDRAEEHAARLALHFGEAAALSPSVQDKAAHYATVAGRQSLSQAAFADAARHFQVALSALGSEVMDARRAGILTGLGEAQRGALQVGPAWQNLVGALDFYVAARDAPNVATVASLLGTAEFFRPDLAHQLGRALAVVDPDTVDGAIVLTNFAYAMGFEGNLEESLAAFDQAERVLRSAAAASELVAHLMKRTSVRAFALEYDMNRLHELSELATSLGRQREAQEAYFYIGSIHLWRGDLDSAAQAFDRLSELAERMGIAFVLANATLLTAGVQVLRGEFETALHTLARRSNRAPVDGRLVWLRSHIEIELSLTRAMETVGDVVQWVVDLGRHGGGPGIVIVEACRAALYGQGSSYLTTARTMAQQEIGAAMTPMDRMWLAMGLALLACHDHDAAMAAAAREWLAPHRGLMAGNWTYHNDHLTGLLSLEFGDVEAAIADFESALAFQSRGYVVPYARTAHDCARALLRRRRPGDVERARSLLDEAIAISRRCGMKPLLNLCLALKLESQGIAPGDTLTSIAALSAAVDRERPSLAADADPTGAVTLMFTDIEGSTALTQQLGDAAWVALLRTHNAIVEEQVRAHGGRVVKNRGDGYMAAFPNPNAAIEAALAIQEKLKNWGLGTGDWVKPSIGGARGDAGHSPQSTVPSTPVRVRIGVHSGNPVRDGDDFFGTDVNLAARIADRALGGEVLISERVHTAVPGRAVDEPVEVELKGLSGLQRLYRVRAGGS